MFEFGRIIVLGPGAFRWLGFALGDMVGVDLLIRSRRLVAAAGILFLFLLGADSVFAAAPAYVMVQPGDCINTFTVRLIVAASNDGAAYGEFDGSRLYVVRRGSGPQNCWLEMGQWGPDGRFVDGKRLKCLFENPLEQGG